METVTFAQILGPLGGTIAASWAAGAASGYIFATKIMKNKISFLEEEIKLSDKRCDARIKATCDRYDSELETMKKLVHEYMRQTNDIQKKLLEIK